MTNEFKDWQLLVLTHDEQFYQRISRLAPDWSRLEFTSWSYEDGPRTAMFKTADMLGAARDALEGGDRVGAATKGRTAVEEFLQEMCQGMAAPLPFRRGAGNDRRETGELITGLRRRLREEKDSYPHVREKPFLTDDSRASITAGLAMAYLRKGDPKQALELARSAPLQRHNLGEGLQQSLFLRALAAYLAGQHSRAISDIDRLAGINPAFPNLDKVRNEMLTGTFKLDASAPAS